MRDDSLAVEGENGTSQCGKVNISYTLPRIRSGSGGNANQLIVFRRLSSLKQCDWY